MKAKLTNDCISAACDEAGAYLRAHGADSKEQLRIRFHMEEVLLRYQALFGSEAAFILDTGRSLGRCKIRLTVPGAQADPFVPSEYSTDEDLFIRKAMTQMGRLPRWRYRQGLNEVVFTSARKRLPEWSKLALAIGAAVALGFAVKLLPPELGAVIEYEVIAPLMNTFLGFLNAIAGPMIFLSVVWGIYSIGDAATFSELGKRLGLIAGALLVGMTVATALVFLPLFHLHYGAGQAGSSFSSLYRMVLDIVPTNLFTPFARGNTLQILFVAVIVGISMLLIGKDTHRVADLTEQLGFIVNSIMAVVSGLVPVFVFGSLFNIVAASDFGQLLAGGKFFFASLASCVLLLVLHTAVVCIRCKMSPLDLWRKCFPTFLIGLTTASSSAAFADNLHTCTEKLGISQRLANFGVPFGQILYKPAASLLFWFAAVSTAEAEGVEISFTWIVTGLLVSMILSVAMPPVPGGMSASFSILFAQLGLSAAGISVILSLNSILDFVGTATCLFSNQCMLKLTSLRSNEQKNP